jgi:hypothetical protein
MDLAHRLAHPDDQPLQRLVVELPVVGRVLLAEYGIACLDNAQRPGFSRSCSTFSVSSLVFMSAQPEPEQREVHRVTEE